MLREGMRPVLGLFAGCVGAIALLAAAINLSAAELPFPADYRQWVFLSSGLGMSYESEGSAADPTFDNVFASRPAYEGFQRTGTWPRGTVLVLEIRSSRSHGSINQSGHYQDALREVIAEAKDQSGRWTFYDFGNATSPGKPFPPTAACYSCHAKNAAVDNTFVQFYPTLLAIAKQKGTIKNVRSDR